VSSALRAVVGALLAVLVVMGSITPAAFALSPGEIRRLKQAGVDDATLELIVRERLIETAAFTVDEIVALKAAGVGKPALGAILAAGSFLKERAPVVYGRELHPLRFATAKDIITLKNAGVSDAVIEAIVAVSRPGADVDREAAYRLLREMGIWVDVRQP
jgi:hypothetical protein